MKFRRFFTAVVLITTLLIQFLPGTVFAPRPVAASGCDAAQFVADVTIPDGTSFAPGSALVKTWRLKNVGSCTWSTSYAIVFYSGSKMGAPSVVNMPYSVAPGATVDLTVNMTAPTTAGHYRGYWMLRNASSVLFGVGPTSTYWFFIDIVVAGSGGSSGTAYDFVASDCSAVWTSGAGALPCPGADGDARGFVQNLSAPQLENGSIGAAGLLTAPQNITDGYIQGVYPAFAVQSGDHFVSIINCQYGATDCYVTFQLNYQIGSGPIYTLKTFKEKTDGMFYNLDVNLSGLAGQNVNFILKVLATGSPIGDRAVWSGARISRAGGSILPGSTCDAAAFVSDITIPDGTYEAPGAAFTKTWRLQNVGTCTWTTAYKLVFAGGDFMGVSGSAFNLPSNVAPGGTIDLSLNLTAPITSGNFIGYWKLRNASGADFGVGASGTSAFLVSINVVSSYTSAYDFVSNAGSASWSSGAGALPFPGTDGDVRGFALQLGSHQMEDGLTSSEGLLTFPQYVTDGYIQGIYPGFTVQSGDHFQSYVGCKYSGPADCYVIFRLAYQIGAGPFTSLRTAAERVDGLVYRMDVDLSSLAGSNVNFILKVEAFGSASGDRAVWSAPRIVRGGSVTPGSMASTTIVTADTPDPSIPGQAVAVSVTVSGAGATPTGTVAITGADTNCSLTLSGGSGSCNVVFNTTGAKTLSGSYSGDGTYAGSSDTESHTVSSGLAASTTTINGDVPDSSTPAQTVAVSVTVSGAGVTPTGTVAITGANTNCTITLSSGSGSCNVVFSTTGAKTLTATYSGDAVYTGSLDTESHTVATATSASATTITSHIPDPSTPGSPVVVSVTVNGAGVPIASGTVAITGADTNCNILLAAGSGSCSVVFNSIGTKTLIATYSGDLNYASSLGSATHTVIKGSSTISITSDLPDPSVPTQAVAVNVTVFGAGMAPTGTVGITGADINCTVTLSGGSGSCPVVFNTIGSKTLTATYSGDGNYLSSVMTEGHVVKNTTTTVITSDNLDPSLPGGVVTVSVKVSGAGVAPSGNVDITGADVNCTIVGLAADGTGSCAVTFNTAGAKVLTATYAGDTNYSPSVGTANHTVNQGPSITTFTMLPLSASGVAPNQLVAVTAIVTGAVVAPTGSVSITISGGQVSTCNITLVAGTGVCSISFSATGTFTLTGTYSGDGNYTGSVTTHPYTLP